MGASGASAPPASITSARASRIAWNASPTAIVPDAQLMALVEFGPVKPNSMAMLQLAAPGNTASASAGSSPRGPCVRKLPTCASANATPPSAEPIMAPTRSPSSRPGSSSASARASRALVTASWEKRSSRLARFALRWSCGRKSGISAAMRLLNGVGSKRVISRTAERRAVSPCHRPSAAVPIGVTAPTPVMTTRRLPLFIWPPFTPGRWPRVRGRALQFSFDPCERSRSDPVYEHGPDHEARRERPDERPPGSLPLVNHGDEDTFRLCSAAWCVGNEPPHDAHTRRDTPNVTIPDFARRPVDCHFRHPPDRVAQQPERAPRGHLDGAAVVRAVQKPDPAVMRQDLWPPFDLRRDREGAGERRPDHYLINGAHGSHAATTPPRRAAWWHPYGGRARPATRLPSRSASVADRRAPPPGAPPDRSSRSSARRLRAGDGAAPGSRSRCRWTSRQTATPRRRPRRPRRRWRA